MRKTQNATFLWVDFSLAFFLVLWRTRNVRAALALRYLLAGHQALLGAPDLIWRPLIGAVRADARRRLCLKAASSSPFPPADLERGPLPCRRPLGLESSAGGMCSEPSGRQPRGCLTVPPPYLPVVERSPQREDQSYKK